MSKEFNLFYKKLMGNRNRKQAISKSCLYLGWINSKRRILKILQKNLRDDEYVSIDVEAINIIKKL